MKLFGIEIVKAPAKKIYKFSYLYQGQFRKPRLVGVRWLGFAMIWGDEYTLEGTRQFLRFAPEV
jgi:hypothetical protein